MTTIEEDVVALIEKMQQDVEFVVQVDRVMYGPFETFAEATEWAAERHGIVFPLYPPMP